MLVGRAAELERIDGLLADAREGRSGVLVVLGEPGIGKTALLTHAERAAADMRVLRATGAEAESELPFAALHALVRPVLSYLERVPESQAEALRGALGLTAVRDADPFLCSAALLSLLAEVAEEQPVVCVLDDAHWLDHASRAALLFASRRLEAERVAILLGVRSGEEAGFDLGGLDRLTLGGVDDAAATSLLVRDGVPAAPDVAARLLRETHGNPLALVELTATLTPGQLAGSEPLPEPLLAGPTMSSLFGARVERLPGETQRVLLLAAAEPSGDLSIVSAAATIAGSDVAELAPAEADRLVRIGRDAVEFGHPLIRSAVYHGASFVDRRAAHEALAEACSGHARADRRAWHRASATTGPDDEVAAELEETADAASRRAGFGAAASALERAAELTSTDGERARRLVAAARAAFHAGQADRARAALERARPWADAEVAAAITELRGLVELHFGDPTEAYAMLIGAAWARLPTDPAGALRLASLAEETTVYSGDPRGFREVGELAEQAIAAAPDEIDRALVGTMCGVKRLLEGDVDAAVPFLLESIELSKDSDVPARLLMASRAALVLGDNRQSNELASRAESLAREQGAVSLLPRLLERVAYRDLTSGRISSAVVHASEGIRLARELGQDPGTLLVVLAFADATQGREAEARQHIDEALESSRERRLGLVDVMAAWAAGMLELTLGRYDEALSRLGAIAVGPLHQSQPVIAPLSITDFAEAAARAGRPEEARPMIEPYEAYVARTQTPFAVATLHRVRGLLGDGEEGEEELRAAIAQFEAADLAPFALARTRLFLGERLRRDRRRKDARDHLRLAAEAFGRMGMRPWEERALAELRATGETLRRHDAGGLDELTPQELQIARLVASGARNREIGTQLFLSPRTIDYHLRKVFAKLGISSRGELARLPLDPATDAERVPVGA